MRAEGLIRKGLAGGLCCLLVLSLGSGRVTASVDERLDSKGLSYAPNMGGKAPVYQIVSLFEQAVQQNDLDFLEGNQIERSSRLFVINYRYSARYHLTRCAAIFD